MFGLPITLAGAQTYRPLNLESSAPVLLSTRKVS